jgi:hypothetical protein
MILFDCLEKTRQRISNWGIEGVREIFYQLWVGEPLLKVPWYSTTATNRNEYESEIDDGQSVDISIGERLRSLGYK